MKTFKKIIPLLMAATMAMPMFASCSKDEGDYDFTIWCYQTDTSIGNYAESPTFKELERRTGKKVKFILGTDSENMIATQSYPEVCLWLGYNNGYARAIADGVVKDITNLVKDYAPNYKKLITANKDIWLNATTTDDNGNLQIGAFAVINSQIEDPWRGYVMRKDFIEENKSKFTTYSDWEDLGEKDSEGNILLTPTLYTHWTDIFTVAKKMYRDSNGKEGFKYPVSVSAVCYDMFDSLNAGFDLALGDSSFYCVDGEMKTGFLADGFDDYYSLINQWYEAGFITPNFAESSNGLTTSTTEILGTKRVAPTSMCFPEISSYIDSREKKAKENGIEDFELMGVPNPRQTKDQTTHLIQTNGWLGMSAAITTKCSDEKAKEIVEWFDYLYSEEGIELMNYGVEGESYTKNADGTKTFCDGIINNPDTGWYEYASYGFPTVSDVTRQNIFKSKHALSVVEAWKYKNDGAWNLKSTVTFSAADGAESAQIWADAGIYIQETVTQFIKGTKPLSDFESYRSQLINKYNVDRAVELRQNAYNAWYQREIPEDWKA